VDMLLEKNPEDDEIVGINDRLKQVYENFLDCVNDRLIENLEQNIVFKFNIKELLDLNQNNHNQVNFLYKDLDELLYLKSIFLGETQTEWKI
jgi:hypothetical protein